MREGAIYQSPKVRELNERIAAAEGELRSAYPALAETFAADMASILGEQARPVLFLEADPSTGSAELGRMASDLERVISRELEPFSYGKPLQEAIEADETDEEPRAVAAFYILDAGEKRGYPLPRLTSYNIH